MADETGLKWWIRYVIVPVIGGGGVIAIVVASLNKPDRPILNSSPPAIQQKQEPQPSIAPLPSQQDPKKDSNNTKRSSTQPLMRPNKSEPTTGTTNAATTNKKTFPESGECYVESGGKRTPGGLYAQVILERGITKVTLHWSLPNDEGPFYLSRQPYLANNPTVAEIPSSGARVLDVFSPETLKVNSGTSKTFCNIQISLQ